MTAATPPSTHRLARSLVFFSTLAVCTLCWFSVTCSGAPLRGCSSTAFVATPSVLSPSSQAATLKSPGVASENAVRSLAPPVVPSAAAPSAGDPRCFAYNLTFGTEGDQGTGGGRVALVTGASRGIGLAIAKALAVGGVEKVLCVARDQAACDAAAAEIRALGGGEAFGFGVDVGNGAAVAELCERLLGEFGRVDILVNNAGITKDNLFIRMSEQEWHDVINVNLNSAFYFTSPLIKKMIKNKFGRIINMSSVVGVGGNAGQANYAASKAGLIGFTKALAKEYAGRGVTVNAIAPGFIRSAMTDKMTEQAKATTLASIPAARLGLPEEVASLAAFLASDQAGYINGKVIPIDGAMLFGAN